MLSTAPISIPNSSVDVQHIVNKFLLDSLVKFSIIALMFLLTEA